MRTSYLFTSESVSEGHPDKVSDQISDAIVDLMLARDAEARVACETMTTTQRIILSGEIRCAPMYDANNPDWAENGGWAPGAKEDIEKAVRRTVREIGYEQAGFHWQSLTFENHLHGQSAEIAQGVDANGNKDEGAGDQGIMFGFACDETPDLMPATLDYSHKILERLASDRKSGAAPFLEPDAKSQVTLRYENHKPVECTAVVVSTQHARGYDKGEKEAELKRLATTDMLTGLMNRARFDYLLKHELGRLNRYVRPFSLIMLDIDYFKQYNDHYGHISGDDCLKRVAQALSGAPARSTKSSGRAGRSRANWPAISSVMLSGVVCPSFRRAR